jgi:hypothetical protein
MLLAAGIGIPLVSYLRLSSTSLRLAHRSLWGVSALNVAETGLEHAMYAFSHRDRRRQCAHLRRLQCPYAQVGPFAHPSGFFLHVSDRRRAHACDNEQRDRFVDDHHESAPRRRSRVQRVC